jgi:hypothetical protein
LGRFLGLILILALQNRAGGKEYGEHRRYWIWHPKYVWANS